MKIDCHDFPDLDVALNAIRIWKERNWPIFQEGNNIDDFTKNVIDIITSEIGIFPNLVLLFKPNMFPFKIFRTRELESINNKELFIEHSYPPPIVTKFGRCNFPNHPVFYGSNDPMTSLLEVTRDSDYTNKQFCISIWQIIDSESEFVFESFLQSDLHPQNNYNQLSEVFRKKIQEPFENNLSESKKLGLFEFLKFIDTEFINAKVWCMDVFNTCPTFISDTIIKCILVFTLK